MGACFCILATSSVSVADEYGARPNRHSYMITPADHTHIPTVSKYLIYIYLQKNVFLLDIFKKVSFVLYPAHSRVGAERYLTHSHTNMKLNFLVINLISKK